MENTEKTTPPIIWSTFGWQMMGMLVSDFESTLAQMLECLKQTSGHLCAKYEQDCCPKFELAAEIREEFSRSRSAETVERLIPKIEALSGEIREFLDERLAAFEPEMLAYGDGPAAQTLRNARQRLVCVKKALEQSAEAIVHQMNAIVLLQKANKLPLDGKYL